MTTTKPPVLPAVPAKIIDMIEGYGNLRVAGYINCAGNQFGELIGALREWAGEAVLARAGADAQQIIADFLERSGQWLTNQATHEEYARQVRDVALEEAAAICDSLDNYANPMTANDCADAIRALKGTPAAPAWLEITTPVQFSVCYINGDDPFVTAISGCVTTFSISVLERDLRANEGDYFNKGDGYYLFSGVWQHADRETAAPAGYELDLVQFTPLGSEAFQSEPEQGEQPTAAVAGKVKP